MVYLITGGAGFVGSHLAQRLLDRGDEVLLMDNLSTGSIENIRHLKKYDRMHYFLEPIENRHLLAELVAEADVVLYLAAGRWRTSDRREPCPHNRNQRERYAAGARSCPQKAQTGVCRLDLRS